MLKRLSIGFCCLVAVSSLSYYLLRDQELTYIFLAHTYQGKYRIDDRLAAMDFSDYNQIWLGGDLCSATTVDSSALEHLDEIFDLGSPTTHWTLGNHDSWHGNIDRITDKTNRPTFYATHFDGITLVVLNSNLSLKHSLDTLAISRQFELFCTVCDTIEHSSHLVVLSHHCLWSEVANMSDAGAFANTDGSQYTFALNPKLKYIDGIYPQLVEVEKKGVEVLHLAGDFGQNQGKFEGLSDDDVQFIGSGITSNTKYNQAFPSAGQPDLILIFEHNVDQQTLTWRFEVLEEPEP